jgi:hypothetical protein
VTIEGATKRRSLLRWRRARKAAEPELAAPEGEDSEEVEPLSETEEIMERRRRIALPKIRRSGKPLADRFAFLRADSPVPVYVGILLVLGGFAIIGVTWGKVAGLLQVPLQLPYLVSGGLTGLGLIMVGITVISVAAKRRDAAERSRQLDQLAEIMRELHVALRGEDEG